MSTLIENLKIKVNEKLYIKDPETSELGKKIIQNSILLIEEIGLEHFTFKKLGERIQSNESSIYRYFENKHKLVIYLSTWYWSWMEYKLLFATNNIENSIEKLTKAITVVTEKIIDDDSTKHINEAILNKIIISEFSKALYTKEVDEDNKEGYFLVYKSVINRLAHFINETNPDYPYSKSLASTIIEGSLHQHFLNDHLKTITDSSETTTVTSFYLDLATRVLQKQNHNFSL
ncbi:TetR/AcrR family transcriptional regulator [Flavobacterium sp. HJJ]|uniref:TetR/AcrR family transcriptional regulator n=1 Tax=Flavobacterium sp. HJJ TaxID=2783792 RepID=UPI00188B39E4|nr:TetR/AcrR family transcriptional regulator [Flavobacterium sp. HJJ]MBF4471932.1 TetR/AcrR family transcriptional regulator [Flavobacterium sp. HJJ]